MFLQRQAQLSKFDDGRNDITSSSRSPDVVPSVESFVFAPDNPDADWAGRVPKMCSKRRVPSVVQSVQDREGRRRAFVVERERTSLWDTSRVVREKEEVDDGKIRRSQKRHVVPPYAT